MVTIYSREAIKDQEIDRLGYDLGVALKRAEVAEAQLAKARGSWQDIATAPKDGSCVLLGHSDKPTIEGYWCSIYAAWCDIAREREVTPQPTHWLPLPPPPIAHEATVLARANKRIENLEGQIDKDMDFTPI